MEESKIIKSLTKESKTKESLNSFKFTPINISLNNNSNYVTNNNEKNFPTYNKSFDLKNSLFDLLKKPQTNFESISSLNLNICKPSKIQSIKKLKKKIGKGEKVQMENFKLFSILGKIKNLKDTKKKKKIIKKENLKKNFLDKEKKFVQEENVKLNIIGKPLDFESDSEKIYEQNLEIEKDYKNLIFAKNENFTESPQNIEKTENKLIINFYNFLKERSLKEDFVKMHKCKFCTATFKKHTALGGHIAKNHPNKSKSYKKRKKL